MFQNILVVSGLGQLLAEGEQRVVRGHRPGPAGRWRSRGHRTPCDSTDEGSRRVELCGELYTIMLAVSWDANAIALIKRGSTMRWCEVRVRRAACGAPPVP